MLAQGQIREAIVEYRVASQLEPKRAEIHARLSQAYEAIGEQEAVAEAVRAADLQPNDVAAQLRAGRLLLVAREFVDAKTRAEKGIALNPNNPEGLILLGNIAAGLKDFDGAITDYQNAIALNNGEELAAYENLATLQNSRGGRAQAEANFRKAVAIAPKSLSARESLASFLWTTGRTTDAEQTLKEALALSPEDLGVNRALGLLYLGTKRVKEAESFFQTIARKNTSPNGALTLADYYRLTGRIDDARHVLRDLAAKDQTYVMATERLAAIDASEGLLAVALEKVQQVLAKSPKDMSARLLKAQVLSRDGKRDEALVIARSIATDAPTSVDAVGALMLIGALETDRGESAKAIQAYEQVLTHQAKPFGALFGLARLNFAGGDFDKAATYAEQALVIQPKNPALRSLLIRIWLAQGKTQQANTELAALRTQFPHSPTVLDLTASQQLSNNQTAAARASYLRAVSISPYDVEAATGLVRLDLAASKVADAVSRVDAGLKQAAPSEEWFILAAQTYMLSKNYEKAERTLMRAIDVAPSRLSNYALLGQLFVEQGRLDDAGKQYELLVRREPSSISANTILGVLLEAEGQIGDAERQYRAVLALDNQAAVASNNLAWIYAARHERLDEALQLAETAVRQSPDDPHFNDTLGWVYYQRAAYQRAIPYLETGVRHDPAAPGIQYHLGMAYFRDGLWDKAREALKGAMNSKASFDGVEEARKTLAVLN